MTLTESIQVYLQQCHIAYDLVPHAAPERNLPSPEACSNYLQAKAIVVKSQQGYRMCVIPATHVFILDWLNRDYQEPYKIVGKEELERIIPGCKADAVPALGQAFGMEVVWDNALRHQEKIYIEAGDRHHLFDLSNKELQSLANSLDRATISCPPQTAKFLKQLH